MATIALIFSPHDNCSDALNDANNTMSLWWSGTGYQYSQGSPSAPEVNMNIYDSISDFLKAIDVSDLKYTYVMDIENSDCSEKILGPYITSSASPSTSVVPWSLFIVTLLALVAVVLYSVFRK